MKKFFIFSVFILFIYNIAVEIDDVYSPSDSGDMMWLNYKLTEYKANHGDVESKWRLLAYYQYNDDLPKGKEIASLIMDIIGNGYGGLKNGGEGVVVELINECIKGRVITSLDVFEAFRLIKIKGGGLTEVGKKIEKKWKNGDYENCKFVNAPN